MDKHLPIPGEFVEVVVDYGDRSTTYSGKVGAKNHYGFQLVGHYDCFAPLRGCNESGQYMFCEHEGINFPKKTAPPSKQRWRPVPVGQVQGGGQYIVYVDNDIVRVTVLALSDIAKRPEAKALTCMIGGTHHFSAESLDSLNDELQSEGLVTFPEFTPKIYEGVVRYMTAVFHAAALNKAVLALLA